MSLISGLASRVGATLYSSASTSQKQTTPADDTEPRQTSTGQSEAARDRAAGTGEAQLTQRAPLARGMASAETVLAAAAAQDSATESGAPTEDEASVSAARHDAMQGEIESASSEKARTAQVDEQNRQIAATNPAQGAYATASLAAVSTSPNATVHSIKMML